MTSWKLMAAAIKAQRTWANLSPAQKAEVRKAAQKAAVNAYARMSDARQPAGGQRTPPSGQAPAQPNSPPPAQPNSPPPPGSATAGTPSAANGGPASAVPPPTESGHRAAPSGDAQAAPPNPEPPNPEPGFVELAREHGPRLARQAANTAATRSRERAGQLADLWRRAQRP